MSDLIQAVNSHGDKQWVPPHFIELSEAGVHGFDFKLPPSARAAEDPAPAATEPKPKAPKVAVNKEDTSA